MAGAGAALGVGRLEDGQLVAAVALHKTGNTGRPVGAVGLKLAGTQSLLQGLAALHKVANGIGLIAVGDDEAATELADGMIDDKAGVRQLGRIESLGADAVGLFHKDAVTAVDAAAHDKVGSHRGLAVGEHAQHDAATGIRIGSELLGERAGEMNVHLRVLLFVHNGGGHQLRGGRQQLPLRLLHDAALQRLGGVAF